MKDVSVISSRRSYEFAQDDIRLTLLCSQPVVAFIKQSFKFELGNVASPMETFGPIAPTIPSGLVFNYGISFEPEESGTAIRLLHFEQRRIVIDVVGPSSAIEPTFSRLRTILEDLRTPERHPAIVEPVSVRDHSEIRATLDFDPEQLVPSTVMSAAADILDASVHRIVPVLTLRVSDSDEYAGGGVPITQTCTLDIRAGTSVTDRIYYCSAPVDSDRHLRFLSKVESSLSS
jgi:hypothetical protein